MSAASILAVKGNIAADLPRGCLIGCCAPTGADIDPNIRQRLEHLLTATQNRLIERFISEKELPAHLSYRDRATMMLDFMNRQAIRARAGAIELDLLAHLDIRVKSVLSLSRSRKFEN